MNDDAPARPTAEILVTTETGAPAALHLAIADCGACMGFMLARPDLPLLYFTADPQNTLALTSALAGIMASTAPTATHERPDGGGE